MISGGYIASLLSHRLVLIDGDVGRGVEGVTLVKRTNSPIL